MSVKYIPKDVQLWEFDHRTKKFVQRSKFLRRQREIQFGRNLRRIRLPPRNPAWMLARIAIDTIGWYLETQEPVPDYDSYDPATSQEPYNFAQAKWTLFNHNQTPIWDYTGVEKMWSSQSDYLSSAFYTDNPDEASSFWDESYPFNDNGLILVPNAKTFGYAKEEYREYVEEGVPHFQYGTHYQWHWQRFRADALPADQLTWTGPVTAPEVPRLLPTKFRMPNPNVERRLSTGKSKQPVLGVGNPLPNRFKVPEYARVVAVASPEGMRSGIGVGRAPPLAGESEGKHITRSVAMGVRLSKALGKMSEAADLVDAVFKALPEDVQKRWSRGRPKRDIDNFGQYGINGVDWKLQAIYHNIAKIDMSLMAQNILANEVEDRLIGAAQGARDRLRPRKWKDNFK